MYVQLHAADILRDDNNKNDKDTSNADNTVLETIDLLKELPDSIRSRKAVTATLASIYHQQGKEQEAEQLLRDTGDDKALAEFAMSQGNYADAQDRMATARWVYASSFVDPERAQKVWSEVRYGGRRGIRRERSINGEKRIHTAHNVKSTKVENTRSRRWAHKYQEESRGCHAEA
jgi:hypothetical protein